METFTEITPEEAWALLNGDEPAVLVDIRDLPRFTYSHAQGAFHLTNQTFGQFLDEYDYDDHIIVSCYHGRASLNTAQFLVEQGFDHVYSVRGGFEGWEKAGLPIETAYE